MQKILVNQNVSFWSKKRENTGIKYLNYLKPFIECLNTMNGVYEDIDGYNPTRDRKNLIVFDDLIADNMANKKF